VPYNRIIEFVTGGPKNYAYKIAKPDKDGNTTLQPHERANCMISFVQGRKLPENLILAITE
jgi:hypothetical protein